jgi:hypothetical protein
MTTLLEMLAVAQTLGAQTLHELLRAAEAARDHAISDLKARASQLTRAAYADEHRRIETTYSEARTAAVRAARQERT